MPLVANVNCPRCQEVMDQVIAELVEKNPRLKFAGPEDLEKRQK